MEERAESGMNTTKYPGLISSQEKHFSNLFTLYNLFTSALLAIQ